MKKIKSVGFLLFAGVVLFASACKKSPSTKIYNTWKLISVDMPDADSVALASMQDADVTYTFSKDGNYKYNAAGTTGGGTFEINEEGTSMTTEENGAKEMINVILTESSLQLSKGNEKMMFEVKK